MGRKGWEEGTERKRNREREEGERKEAETCFPGGGESEEEREGREGWKKRERALERLRVNEGSLKGTGYHLLYSQADGVRCCVRVCLNTNKISLQIHFFPSASLGCHFQKIPYRPIYGYIQHMRINQRAGDI